MRISALTLAPAVLLTLSYYAGPADKISTRTVKALRESQALLVRIPTAS